MKLNITKVTSTDKKKDGTPLTGKFGPYVRVGIQATQYGQQWINGFMKAKPDWEGKEIDLVIKEEEFKGEKQLKFEVPKQTATDLPLNKLDSKLDRFEKKIDSIIAHLNGSAPLNLTSAGTKIPDFSEVDADKAFNDMSGDIDAANIPF